MTLEIRDAIILRERMRTDTVVVRSAKRQMADMMRSESARFVERDFDPGLPQRMLWSNFRRFGFFNSSDFSSLRVGIEDFADYFANITLPSVQIPTASEHLGGFLLRHNDLVECFSAFKSIISKVWTEFLLNFLNYCFHLFVVVCRMYSIKLLNPFAASSYLAGVKIIFLWF
jgi:hypothetical protein